MSEGQMFLLLFGAFYVLECFVLVPPGSGVFVRGFGKYHRSRPSLLEFSGIQKQMYFLYLLPWPGRAHALPDGTSEGKVVKMSGYRRYFRLMNRAAEPLVVNGVFLWAIFFLLIPVTYLIDPMDQRVLLFVVLGYALLFWQTGCFWCLHRRFSPAQGEERLKQVLTMMFLPWHGMKAVDHLVLRPAKTLHPFQVWALLLSPAAFEERAKLEWRRVVHGLGENEDRRGLLLDVMSGEGLDPAKWIEVPDHLEPGQQYCPICWGTYLGEAEACSDCGGVPLKKV